MQNMFLSLPKFSKLVSIHRITILHISRKSIELSCSVFRNREADRNGSLNSTCTHRWRRWRITTSWSWWNQKFTAAAFEI